MNSIEFKHQRNIHYRIQISKEHILHYRIQTSKEYTLLWCLGSIDSTVTCIVHDHQQWWIITSQSVLQASIHTSTILNSSIPHVQNHNVINTNNIIRTFMVHMMHKLRAKVQIDTYSVIVVGHVHQLLGCVAVWASWLAVTVFCSPPPMPIGFISAALTINLTLAEMSFSEQLSTQLPSSLVSCLSDAAPIHELKHRSASSLFTIPNCRRFCNMNSSSSLAASARLENAII